MVRWLSLRCAETAAASRSAAPVYLARTGSAVDAETARNREKNDAEIRALDALVTRSLEACGHKVLSAPTPKAARETGRVYRPTRAMVDTGTGAVDLCYNGQRLQCVPSVMKESRNKFLKPLLTHMQMCERENRRMLTFTRGSRWDGEARLEDVAECYKRFHRTVSEFMRKNSLWNRHFEVHISTYEFGTPKAGLMDGAIYLHIHVHVLVTVREKLLLPDGSPDKARWSAMLDELRLAFGRALRGRDCEPGEVRQLIKDNGRLRNLEECCKYPLSLEDCRELHRLGGDWAVACFAAQMRRLRLVVCHNRFKAFRRWLDEQHQVCVCDRERWRTIDNPNWRGLPPPPPPRGETEAERVAKDKAAREKRASDAAGRRAVAERFRSLERAFLSLVDDQRLASAFLRVAENRPREAGDGDVLRLAGESVDALPLAGPDEFLSHPDVVPDYFKGKCPPLAECLFTLATLWDNEYRSLSMSSVAPGPRLAREFAAGFVFRAAAAQATAGETAEADDAIPERSVTPVVNLVMGVTLPVALGGERHRFPKIVVLGYTGSLEELTRRNERVRALVEFSRARAAQLPSLQAADCFRAVEAMTPRLAPAGCEQLTGSRQYAVNSETPGRGGGPEPPRPGGGFDPLPGSKFDPDCEKMEVLS